MESGTVAHIVHSYLPVTQNWIYNQLSFNNRHIPLVLCQFVQNMEQFPLKQVYPVFKATDFVRLFLTRVHLLTVHNNYLDLLREKKPDLIHGHFSTESIRVLKIVKQLDIPLVTTFYGLDVNKLPLRRYWRKRYPSLFATGDIFIVEGHHMAKQLVKLGCPEDKIRVVHIGIDIERIRAGSSLFNPYNSLVRVLFVGLEREKKGALDAADAFLRAVKVFPDAELHIIGDGRYKKNVEKKFVDAGVPDKVIFHGFVSVEKYHTLLCQSDIVLTPSCTARDGDTEGGAPVLCIEAQAAGKPVVGTEHCDIPEIVLHGRSGLLCPEHEIEALSQNLILLFQNRDLRNKMGDAGIIHARKEHDITKQVAQLNNIYDTLIGHKRSSCRDPYN
ncbi:MAG: glycosyltransferase [Fibrobacter sp.]|nr:glycosyltransferase [Fibrobacter sp.]